MSTIAQNRRNGHVEAKFLIEATALYAPSSRRERNVLYREHRTPLPSSIDSSSMNSMLERPDRELSVPLSCTQTVDSEVHTTFRIAAISKGIAHPRPI
jgi:hypothetical protein